MINVGDVIVLSDEQTLYDLKDLSKGGLEVTVEKVTVFDYESVKYTICDLTNSQLVVVFKEVNGVIEQRCVYWPVEDFVPGSREDVVVSGSHWIFKEPDDIDNIMYENLEMAPQIVDKNGAYNRFVMLFSDDGQRNIAEWEYSSYYPDYVNENPFLIVIEEYNYVRCLQGTEARESELTIFNRSLV